MKRNLYFACKNGNVASVRNILITRGYDELFSQDYEGETCFHLACEHKHRFLVQYLIGVMTHEHLAIMNCTGYPGLHFAYVYYRECFRYLISRLSPITLSIKDDEGWTCFHYACRDGNYSIVKALANKLGSKLLNITNNDGCTGLHIACAHSTGEHGRIVNLILTKLNRQGSTLKDIGGWTPLHYACHSGNYLVFKILLKYLHSDDLLIRDNDGWTPLHCTCISEVYVIIYDILQMLLLHQPELARMKTYGGHTALSLLSMRENLMNIIPVLQTQWLECVDGIDGAIDVFRHGDEEILKIIM